jgi:hypothetical protein
MSTTIADSCSKNKCNTIISFHAHMVLLGIWDVDELLFGPVGHTHMGVDQDHGVHNALGQYRDFATLAVHSAFCIITHSRLSGHVFGFWT